MAEPEYSRLPQIEKLLARGEPARWYSRLSRPLVVRLAGEAVACFRESLRRGDEAPETLEQAVLARLEESCRAASRRRLQRVINATGVLLHTNLGRSPLASEVWSAAGPANCGYSNLELDLETGRRGRRNGLLGELLALLTGAEAALAVNNNAAAVFLILSCLARKREVLVSRGEQVQIGGGFRIPEILSLSGARLAEVGTTNVTTVEDYTAAVTLQTSMALVVHSSNFRIRGFTERPSVESLARALPPDVILAVDQGSGAIDEEIPGEERVGRLLKAGANLVCFSADKLLGGPQAGLIVGRRDLIDTLSRHPLNRVFRPGKTVVSLLEEFLVRRLNGEQAGAAGTALALSVEELRRRGRGILRGLDPRRARLVASVLTTGGGTGPDESFPSVAIELAGGGRADTAGDAEGPTGGAETPTANGASPSGGAAGCGPAGAAGGGGAQAGGAKDGGEAPAGDGPAGRELGAQELLERLRRGEPAVIGAIRDGKVLLDLSTVLPDDLPLLRRALQALLTPG
jgi:L-seryl-tRNA(Ser) seleniumtransferase